MAPVPRIAAISLILAGVLAAGALWATRHASPPGRVETPPLADLAIGGPFTLVDQAGHPVTQADFAGRWLLIYFGYTTCPDICPTTLQMMVNALDAAGPAAGRVTPLFITVDPARDTPAVLARYTALFGSRIKGLTGSQAQISAAERSFKVYAARAPQPGTGSYLMDHTSFIYLMAPDGRLQALFGADATAPAIAARIKALLG